MSIMSSQTKNENRDYVKGNCNIFRRDPTYYNQSALFGENNSTYLVKINSAIVQLHLAKTQNLQEARYRKKELTRLYDLYEQVAGSFPRPDSFSAKERANRNASPFCQAAASTFEVFDIITKALRFNSSVVRHFYLRRVRESREKHIAALVDRIEAQGASTQTMTSRRPESRHATGFFAALHFNQMAFLGLLGLLVFGVLVLCFFRGTFVSLYLCSINIRKVPTSFSTWMYSWICGSPRNEVPPSAVSQQVSDV